MNKVGLRPLLSACWTPTFVGESGLKGWKKTLNPLFPAKAGIQRMKNDGQSPILFIELDSRFPPDEVGGNER